ncbi:MAG: hypothetical protein RL693_1204 [Verrucomicrobiota bacterium]|jgi:hypothetical protein
MSRRVLQGRPFQSKSNQFRHVLESELLLDVGAMRFNGLDTQMKGIRDSLCARPFSDHLQNFLFAISQRTAKMRGCYE